MSLPWGGLFDINSNWKTPQNLHQTGIHADIEKKSIKKIDRAFFINFACNNFHVRSEGDKSSETAHYHLELRNQKIKYENKPDMNINGIECCLTPTDKRCISLYRNGSIVTEPDEPSDCD